MHPAEFSRSLHEVKGSIQVGMNVSTSQQEVTRSKRLRVRLMDSIRFDSILRLIRFIHSTFDEGRDWSISLILLDPRVGARLD